MNLTTINIDTFLNDLWTIHLAIFSITITLFTVLFSFLFTKKEELKTVMHLIKHSKEMSLINEQKAYLLPIYINGLKRINSKLLLLLISSFIVFIASYIAARFITNVVYKERCFYALISLSILTICFLSYSLFEVIGYYKKTLKLN